MAPRTRSQTKDGDDDPLRSPLEGKRISRRSLPRSRHPAGLHKLLRTRRRELRELEIQMGLREPSPPPEPTKLTIFDYRSNRVEYAAESAKRAREENGDEDEAPAPKRTAFSTPTRKPQNRVPKSAPSKMSDAEVRRAELRRYRNEAMRKHNPIVGRRRTIGHSRPGHNDAHLEPTRTPRADNTEQEHQQEQEQSRTTNNTPQHTTQQNAHGAGIVTSIWNWGTRIFGTNHAGNNQQQNIPAQNAEEQTAPEENVSQANLSPQQNTTPQSPVQQASEDSNENHRDSVFSPQRQPRRIQFPSAPDSPDRFIEEDDDMWMDNTGLVPEKMSADERAQEIADQEYFLLRKLSQKRARLNQDLDKIEGRIEGLEDTRHQGRREEDFEPVLSAGTNKRKLAGVDEAISRISPEEAERVTHALQHDRHISTGERHLAPNDNPPATPPAKSRANASQQAGSLTPRSVLRKPGTPASTYRARFGANPVSSTKVFGGEGPAGMYTGNTFADPKPQSATETGSETLLSHSSDGMSPHGFSPRTKANTRQNYDPFVPSPGRPAPGTFEVPYDDDSDFESDAGDADITITAVQPTRSAGLTVEGLEGDDSAQPPSTPRPTHAELPPKSVSSVTTDTSFEVSTSPPVSIDQVREKAQRFKPRVSSGLSNVESFVESDTSSSSLSSLPLTEAEERAMEASPFGRSLGLDPRPATPASNTTTSSLRQPLDNSIKGPDDMTAYEREHQYDDWAKGLSWPGPQTYEQSIGVDPYITNLINRRWTEEDSRRSREFWSKEFDEVDVAMNEAKRHGKVLRLVTEDDEAL